MASLAVAMPGFAAEFRGLTYFTLCHSLADTMSLKRGGSSPPYALSAVTSYMHPGTRPGTHDTRARTTPRRENPQQGKLFTTGRMRVYGCEVIDAGAESGRRVQNAEVPFPACAASGRNRNQNRRAEPKQPPNAGRRWPPPDRRAPRPHRRPSCRQRSRLRPPPRHAGWSPR